MLSFFSPFFEVVKEGRILKKIKHLQNQTLNILKFTPGLDGFMTIGLIQTRLCGS
jgi:hypothetical protein